jgi:hypothetical protein
MARDEGYFATDAEYQAELDRLRPIESLGDPATTRRLAGLGVETGGQCLEVGPAPDRLPGG